MMTILVVDDEPTMPRLFDQRYRKEIREGQLAFRYAASGEEALTTLDQEGDRISLVLSDINMPGMTGLDLLDALRQRGFSKPVFMISAYDGSDYEVRALEKGARGFLPKPMRFDDLNALIRSLKGS